MNLKALIVGIVIIGSYLGQSTSHAAYSNTKTSEACQFMASAGLSTSGYKTDSMSYYCVSQPKPIGEGYPLPNTIGYHTNGDASTVKKVYLVLNVNQKSQAKAAYAALLKDAELLTKKALGENLPTAAKEAIKSGKSGNWKVKQASVKVSRENWPTGKGHEVKFIIE